MGPTTYMDESGDLGFSFPESSAYLTIACITVLNTRALKKAMRRLRQRLGIPRKAELKATRDRWSVRKELLSLVPSLGIEVHAVSIYKPNVYDSLRTNTNVLYNWAAVLLLRRHLCSLPAVSLVVDLRELKVKGLPYQLDDYLRLRVVQEEQAAVSLTIRHEDSFVSPGVQLADCVANALWRRRERTDRKGYDVIYPQIREERSLFEP